MEGIKVQQPGQPEVPGCGIKRMMPRPFRTLSLGEEPGLGPAVRVRLPPAGGAGRGAG